MSLNTILDDIVESRTTDLRDEALYALCDIVMNLDPSSTRRWGPTDRDRLCDDYNKLHDFMRAMEAKHETDD